MIFPPVSGKNLLRENKSLPRDFIGRVNLLFVAFEQWQQSEVDTWGPFAGELENEFEGLAYYELPTIQSRNTLYQMFINEGMRAGIPNQKSRERTITLYLDKNGFREALEMPDEAHIYILLVDREGRVYSCARGVYTPEALAVLQQTLRGIFLPANQA